MDWQAKDWQARVDAAARLSMSLDSVQVADLAMLARCELPNTWAERVKLFMAIGNMAERAQEVGHRR